MSHAVFIVTLEVLTDISIFHAQSINSSVAPAPSSPFIRTVQCSISAEEYDVFTNHEPFSLLHPLIRARRNLVKDAMHSRLKQTIKMKGEPPENDRILDLASTDATHLYRQSLFLAFTTSVGMY